MHVAIVVRNAKQGETLKQHSNRQVTLAKNASSIPRSELVDYRRPILRKGQTSTADLHELLAVECIISRSSPSPLQRIDIGLVSVLYYRCRCPSCNFSFLVCVSVLHYMILLGSTRRSNATHYHIIKLF